MSVFKNVLIVVCPPPLRDGRPSVQMINRARKAIQLAKKNNYSRIIFSGGPSRKNPIPSADVMRLMTTRHLDSKLLLVERNSRDLLQSAVFCWELLKDQHPKKVTVLTGRFALRRAKYIFRKAYQHLHISLSFETCTDSLDIVESAFLRLKELFLLAKVKIWGLR